MAHFAKLDESNNVTNIYVVSDDIASSNSKVNSEQFGIEFVELHHGNGWYKETYKDGSFRKNYAGVGFTYDSVRDAFIAPQPFPSWTLNEDTCQWEAPVAYPDDDKMYNWDESTTNWKEVI